MDYAGKLLGNMKVLVALSATLSCFVFMGGSATVFAQNGDAPPPTPNYNLPRPANFDQGNNVHLLVARRDNVNYFLRATTSVVRVYTPDPTWHIRIEGGGSCAGTHGDAGNVENSFRVYALEADNSTYFFNNTPYIDNSRRLLNSMNSNGMNCNGFNNLSWNVGNAPGPLSMYRSTVPPFNVQGGLYALEIVATVSSGVGWNMFQYDLDSPTGNNNDKGRLSFYAGSGDEFALKSRAGTGRGDFRLGFAPGCGVTESRVVRVRWFDADAGVSNQGTNPVRTVIREYSDDGVQTGRDGPDEFGLNWNNGAAVLNITDGDDEAGDQRVRVNPFRKYMWTWENINDANGIQFQMPYDSYNTLLDAPDCPRAACEDGEILSSTQPANPDGSYPVGTTVTVGVTVRNNGGSPWLQSYRLEQRNPADFRRVDDTPPTPAASQVPVGGTHQFIFNITRGTPGSHNPRYNMANGRSEPFGPTTFPTPCQFSLRWGNVPPGTFTLEIDCETITIRDATAGSSATLRFTRTSGVGGPPTLDYVFNIPSSDYVIDSTFGVDNRLLPHNTYNVVLIIGATSTQPVGLGRCMEATCSGSVGGDPEPGQFVNIEYGGNLVNRTNKDFDDIYTVRVTTAPPGSITNPSTWDITGTMLANNTSSFEGPQRAQVNYTSNLTANLFYDGTNNLASIFTSFPCTNTITPKTRPYLSINYGDVSTGGAFLSAGVCSGIIGPTPGNPYPGGIRTFANPDVKRGSGVDFAAYALGLIQGNADGPFGFFSSKVNGSEYDALSFANYPDSIGVLGGLFGGTSANSSHCATDYYAGRPATVTPGGASPINLSSLTGDTRIFRDIGTGNVNIFGTIPNARVSIYVNGDVFIDGNINYPATWNINSPPYLAIIARGNIIVRNTVSEINGLFVAQPRTAAAGGIFSTCSHNPSATIQPPQITNLCRGSDLTVNGAVIAKDVRLYRASHTLYNSSGPAETFNFVPSMVIGFPNFSSSENDLESLLSLPPVF